MNKLKLLVILLVLTLTTACSNSSKVNQMKKDNEELIQKNSKLEVDYNSINSEYMDLYNEYSKLRDDYEALRNSKTEPNKQDLSNHSSSLVFKDTLNMEVRILKAGRCTSIVSEGSFYDRCIIATLIDEEHNTPFIISTSEDNSFYSKIELGKIYKIDVNVIVVLDKTNPRINFFI